MTVFASIELEGIVLQTAVESIQSMVNHEIFGFSSNRKALQATFRSLSQRALFNVLLADMLEAVDPALLGTRGSLLDALHAVPRAPQLGSRTRARRLNSAVGRLTRWLGKVISPRVWFPSIDTDIRLTLRRRDFVSICGNISKHNISRLTRKARSLRDLLAANGVTIGSTDALRALEDFHARFHDDILVYHSTTLAEMLNNIRWAIHEYLLPRFHREYVPPKSDADPRYSFKIPPGIQNKYAQERYWDLMNSVRGKPWIPRFKTSPNLKGQY